MLSFPRSFPLSPISRNPNANAEVEVRESTEIGCCFVTVLSPTPPSTHTPSGKVLPWGSFIFVPLKTPTVNCVVVGLDQEK